MNLKPEELIRAAMMENPEEGVKELRKSIESTTKCCCAVQTTNEWYKILMREAADQIERDQKEIKELWEKVPQWISVEDRMPDTVPCDAGTEYSEAVVVWTNGKKAMIAVWDGIDWICPCDFLGAWGEEITHWMPLPEPPKEDNHEN